MVNTPIFDIHTHILPGVDDGADSFQEALQLLREEEKQGVTHVILTPHFRRGMFETSEEDRVRVYERFKLAAHEEGIQIKLLLGCELHKNSDFLTRASDRRNRMPGNVVLLEFSESASFREVLSAVSELKTAGYDVIIAHAERIEALKENLVRMKKLKEAGAYLQITSGAFLKVFGNPYKKTVIQMLDAELVDFAATDAHDPKYRKPDLKKCILKMEKKYGAKAVKRIFSENPRKLFIDREKNQDAEN